MFVLTTPFPLERFYNDFVCRWLNASVTLVTKINAGSNRAVEAIQIIDAVIELKASKRIQMLKIHFSRVVDSFLQLLLSLRLYQWVGYFMFYEICFAIDTSVKLSFIFFHKLCYDIDLDYYRSLITTLSNISIKWCLTRF